MYAAGSGQVNIFNLIILLTKTIRIFIKNSLHRRHQQHPHHHREHPCHLQHNSYEKVEVVKLLLAHPATCLNIIIIITRPKPAYGRYGLAGSWGQDTDEVSTFLVFLTSHFAPVAFSSDINQHGTINHDENPPGIMKTRPGA